MAPAPRKASKQGTANVAQTVHIPEQKREAATKLATAAGLTLEAWILQAVDRQLEDSRRIVLEQERQELVDRALALTARPVPLNAVERTALAEIDGRLREIDSELDPGDVVAEDDFDRRMDALEAGLAELKNAPTA